METLGDIMDRIDRQKHRSPDAKTKENARQHALKRASWEFLHGHITAPSIDELARQEWEMGLVESACKEECLVEPDGYCSHGNPSWMLVLGMI